MIPESSSVPRISGWCVSTWIGDAPVPGGIRACGRRITISSRSTAPFTGLTKVSYVPRRGDRQAAMEGGPLRTRPAPAASRTAAAGCRSPKPARPCSSRPGPTDTRNWAASKRSTARLGITRRSPRAVLRPQRRGNRLLPAGSQKVISYVTQIIVHKHLIAIRSQFERSFLKPAQNWPKSIRFDRF